MFHNPRKIIFHSLGIFVFIGILVFSYFRYSRYIQGPEIISINIENFMTIDSPSLLINATIKNTKSVSLNGRNIILNNKIYFNEILVFSPKTNIIEIVLTDMFGKTKSYTYSIYYKIQNREHPKTLKTAKEVKLSLNNEEPLINN